MSSAVVLTLPGDKPAEETYAKQLIRGSNAMSQSSLLTGMPSALGLSEDGYALMVFENGTWVVKSEQALPEGVRLTFEREALPVKLSEDIMPAAIFEPSGQATVFSLVLSGPQRRYELISRGDGRVVLERAS